MAYLPSFLSFLIFTLICSSCVAVYEIKNNQASKHVYRSDINQYPVIAPHPKDIKYGSGHTQFHECNVTFTATSEIFDEIISVYKDITFGKGYDNKCPNIGKEIKVEINSDAKVLLPKGFDPKYEEYSLEISESGDANISADFYPGVIRALDSLSQLIIRSATSESEYSISYLPITIKDSPEFAYRGIMLDTSREYFYPDTLKQLLDSMLFSRINVFHWHFMDDDSFPLYMEAYPDLTNYTAFTPEEIYTPKMIKEIVQYAKIRGVRIIPGVNGPGNVNILGKYPGLQDSISCYRNPVVNGYAYGSPYGGTFDPLENGTYEFYKNLMGEIHKNFECEYCHNSGIIPEYECWDVSPDTAGFIHQGGYHKKDLTQIFLSKRKEAMKNSDAMEMTKIYWYQNQGIKYEEEDILQFWGDANGLEIELEYNPNNKFIMSPFYMNADCGYLTPFGKNTEYCRNPLAPPKQFSIPKITKRFKEQVLGFEIPAWSEMNNEFDFLVKLNPGSAAKSFKYWNPGYEPSSGKLREELMRVQYRMKAYGIPTSKISMRYCEEHTHHCFGE